MDSSYFVPPSPSGGGVGVGGGGQHFGLLNGKKKKGREKGKKGKGIQL